MDPLQRTGKHILKLADEMRTRMQEDEKFRSDVEYNMKEYGVPFLSVSYCNRHREDLVRDLRSILFEEMPYKPVEIRIYPEGSEGYHWAVEYNLLVWDEKRGMVKALDYEREKRGGNSNGDNGSKGTDQANLSEQHPGR